MINFSEDVWFNAIMQSRLCCNGELNVINLPTFPPEQLQIDTTGCAKEATMKFAYVFYKKCISTLSALGIQLNSKNKLLDFGTGWGRICRFFLKDLPLHHIYGLDLNQELIDICRETFKSTNFTVCNPFPPTQFPENFFNLITGYSVFSHLSEQAVKLWMKEFHRILLPHGMVVVTTRGRDFLEYCEQMKKNNPQGYLKALSEMFVNFNDAKRRYDAGEFVHSNTIGVSGGGVLTSEFYGESFIPEQYAKTAYADLFTLEKFIFEPGVTEQAIMFFRKK